jgi:hypothetical protein
VPSNEGMPRSSRRPSSPTAAPAPTGSSGIPGGGAAAGVPQGTPIRGGAAGGGRTNQGDAPRDVSDADFTPLRGPRSQPSSSGRAPSRDNSSRFDD